MGKDGMREACKDSQVTDEVGAKINMEGVPVGGHGSAATEGTHTEAECLFPVVEAPRGALMDREGSLKVGELKGVT